jgi:hypothetical protein
MKDTWQHFTDYMAEYSIPELHEVVDISRQSEQKARLDGNCEMASYHAWTRIYAERELQARNRHDV